MQLRKSTAPSSLHDFGKILILELTKRFSYSIVANVRKAHARVAQLVERDLAKVEAAGSSPVSRSEKLLHAKSFFFF